MILSSKEYHRGSQQPFVGKFSSSVLDVVNGSKGMIFFIYGKRSLFTVSLFREMYNNLNASTQNYEVAGKGRVLKVLPGGEESLQKNREFLNRTQQPLDHLK